MWTRLRPNRPEPPGGPAPRRLRHHLAPGDQCMSGERFDGSKSPLLNARANAAIGSAEPATLVIGAMRCSSSCARTSWRRSMNVTGCGPWQRHLAGMSHRVHGSARDEPVVDRRAGLEPGVFARFRPAFRRTPALGRIQSSDRRAHGSRSTSTVLGRRPGSVGCFSYSHATLAFFETYFSNFIEGTEFAVDEAADIAFRGTVPNERPADAHDSWALGASSPTLGRWAGPPPMPAHRRLRHRPPR